MIHVSLLQSDIQFLKGVGETRAKAFNRLEIFCLKDLLRYYPRAYQDFSQPEPIAATVPGETCCIKAKVTAQPAAHYIRKGMTLYKCPVVDDTAACEITFFNNRFVMDMLKPGQEYYFYGRIDGGRTRREMASPEFEPGSTAKGLRPVYPSTEKIQSRTIASAVRQALQKCGEGIAEYLPEDMRRRYELCHIKFALENIHFPPDAETLETARRRLVFEELLGLQMGMLLLKKRGEAETSAVCREPADFSPFFEKLPFTPTGAQIRAVNECAADMMKPKPMNRLVEGDVGSGKTVVAAALCYYAAKNGYQCALMAPTEILARQHFSTLTALLSGCGLTVGLLTGSLLVSEKAKMKRLLRAGQIDVIVGTHALLSKGVEFPNLGLVITDEQHRFGVSQRAELSSKGKSPHMLVMSATPIPRTLSLIVYGDLEVSRLDEMPHGRLPVKTYAVDYTMRERIYAFIRKMLEAGRQAYIVCPLVEETDGTTGESPAAAREYAEKISSKFRPYRVGLLHGKMKPAEKEAAMKAFSEGVTGVLVATTVVEVGVDVPNATIMVVENAERFGLSQLHQLRGRVGRGDVQSYCVLISGESTKESQERLKVMCSTTNGFDIAEKDLKLRGPGDFFGSRQHGLPQLKIADLFSDMQLARMAGEAARETLERDPGLQNPENRALRAMVQALYSREGVVFN